MSQEAPLRLALDNLRFMPHQTPERMEVKRKFLLQMLRMVQRKKEEAEKAKQMEDGQQPSQRGQGGQGQGGQGPPQVARPPSQ